MLERGIDGKTYHSHAERRQAVANYYGLISLVDSHYGRILDALDRKGLFDDTLIIFTSDHGEMLNQFGLWGKTVQYQGAVNIPLMVKLPGQQHAQRCDDLVNHLDILPTAQLNTVG